MKDKPLKNKNKITAKPTKSTKSHVTPFKKNRLYIYIILSITAFVYLKTLQHDFTNWDDNTYLHENPYIKDLSGSGIYKIFSESYFGNYHPLTTLSYAIEYKFFGISPFIFHFNNLLLHLINTFLVFLLIKRLSNRIEIPIITAFLFALHPLHVESVAWVAERKDVLYTLFFLLSINFYLRFISCKNSSLKFIVISFLFFVCSLMSKSAAVTTPVLMLLTAYYIKKKINLKDIIYVVPFFILSLIFGLIAINTQVDAMGNLNILYPGLNRILIVTYALYFYFIKFIFPINLTALHGFPVLNNGMLPIEYYISPVVILVFIALYIFSNKDFRHHLLFGFLFFIFSIALVIQVIPVGQAVVAERYTYVPYIGFSLIIANAYIILQKHISKNMILTAAILYAIFLIITSWQQTETWKDSETLWTKTLEVYPENQIAYNNRGLYRTDKEKFQEAFSDFDKLIEINPEYNDVFNNRATACFKIKDYKCVISDLSEAIKRKPNIGKLYNNRGLAKSLLNDMQGAISDYDKAIELDTLYTDAYNNRINAKEALNDFEGAIKDLNFLIKNTTVNANLYNSRGILYGKINSFANALSDFNQAIALEPDMAEAYTNKGIALLNMENITEACINWNKSLTLGNKNAGLWINDYCKLTIPPTLP